MVANTPESQRAARKRARIRIALAAGFPVPEEVHGTFNGYNEYGCRCDRCKEAMRRKHAKSRIRNRLASECFEEVAHAEFAPGMDHPAMRYIEIQVPRDLYEQCRAYVRGTNARRS